MATENTQPVEESPKTQEAVAAAATGKTEGAATFNANQGIQSVGQLKEMSPKFYNALMQGLALQVISSMQKHEKNLEEIQRQARQDAGG